jgi:nitrous oxide reductase
MTERKHVIARRTWLGAGATAGAAAAAAVLLPSGPKSTPQASAQPAAAPVVEPEGYQLTEHVKQYYASARI